METFRKIAVGDKLKAIDVCLMDTEKEALIIGKEYEVRERGKDEEGEYILIYSEIGEHTFDIDELSEFFESEPTSSRESEYMEVLESHAELFRRLNQIRNKGKIEGLENLIDRALTKARAINKKFAENDENQIPKHQIGMPK